MKKIRVVLSLLLVLAMVFGQIPMLFAEDVQPETEEPTPPPPEPVIEGKVSPIYEGWVYDFDTGDYTALFGYETSYKIDGEQATMTEAVGPDNKTTPSTYQDDLLEAFPWPNLYTDPNGPWPGNRPGRSDFENPPIQMDGWDGSNIVWKLFKKTATASVPGNQNHNKTIMPTINILEEDVTIMQGDTVQLNVEINKPDGVEFEFEYAYDVMIGNMTLASVSQEQMPIVMDLGSLAFKGYDVGTVTVRAYITNSMPQGFPNPGMWPVPDDMATITVIPKLPIAYEYGSFGLSQDGAAPQTRIGLEGDYEKLAVLAQVVEPVMMYLDDLMTNGTQSAVVGNLRNDILSRDNGRSDIQDHEYHLLEDEFYTLYESSKGPAPIKPFNYLAADSGILLDGSGRAIGLTDTTIIDYEDRETNDLSPLGVNSNPTPEIHRINFNRAFNQTPVVVAQLSSYVGTHYSHIRIVNVTPTYFDVFIEEWDKHRASDGHYHEYMSYLAVEPGTHVLANGDTLEAGFNNGPTPSAHVVPNMQSGGMIYFDTIFDELPILFSQTQTRNDSQQVWVGQHPFGVMMQLPYAPTDGPSTEDDVLGFAYELLTERPPHGPETVGYVAIGQPYTPYAVRVALMPDSANEFYVPYEFNPAVTQQYTAVVYDQHDKPMDLVPTIEASETGDLDFDFKNGLLTIDQETKAGMFTITASYGDLEPDTLNVTIISEVSKASRMTLEGDEELAVPYVNLPAVVGNYEATVFDQYGWVMPDEAVNVTLGSNTKPAGSVFDSSQNTGTLTIDQDTMGGAFTIVATHSELGDVRLNGTVTREHARVYTLEVRVNRIEMAEIMAYDAEIDVPEHDDGPNVGYFEADATDQYGDPIVVTTSLDASNTPDDVRLVGMNIEVSYDDDAGLMTVWALVDSLGQDFIATGDAEDDIWHFTIDEDDQKSNSLLVNIKKDPSVATLIEWDEYTKEIDVPYEGGLDTYMYTATIYDQYMDDMDLDEAIEFNESSLPDNVSLVNGLLTVIPSSEEGTFDLIATYGDLETEALEVVIAKEDLEPTRIELSGASDIDVPLNGQDPVTEDYTVTVYDQYGAVMEDVPTILRANGVLGTSFEEGTLTVTDQAPHYYEYVYATIDYEALNPDVDTLYMSFEEYDNDEAGMYVFLHKTAEVTADDINNDVLGANMYMEYWHSDMMVPGDMNDAYWMPFFGEMAHKFPGNIDVYVRYGRQYRNGLNDLGTEAHNMYPEGYEPGEATMLEFSVLPPTISGPTSFVTSAIITVTQVEDPDENQGWYDHVTWYRINGGDWNEYNGPFQITASSLIEAKTVTSVDWMILTDSPYEPIIHESSIVSFSSVPTEPVPGVVIESPEVPLGGEEIIEDLTTPLGAVTFNASYLTGYEDGTFRPINVITRAEVATIFARILALDLADTSTMFSDVTGNEWFTAFINAAYSANVVMPRAIDLYGAQDGITRAEFATIVSQYWTYLAIDVEPIANGFDDTVGLGQEPAILKAVAQGVMEGYDGNMFKPEELVTRQQVAQMVNTLLARTTINPLVPTYSDVTPNMMFYGEIEAASSNALISQQ